MKVYLAAQVFSHQVGSLMKRTAKWGMLSINYLLQFIFHIYFCAIVLYLVVYHVCFQDGKLCLLVANDKLDGK
jgi:hypothetical protein